MAQEPFIGGVFIFGGNFAPNGYAFCNGQLMSIAQNSALFSILGTTYGGDGVQTFGLPDLRGRAAVGMGQGPGLNNVVLGELGGQQNVTLLSSNLPAHTHTATTTVNCSGDGRPSTDSPVGAVPDSGSGTNLYAAAPDGTSTMNAGAVTVQIGVAGGSQPLSILNPYLGVNYIIALQGVYPSRS